MKTIQWKIVIGDNEKIASLENAVGLPKDSIESHLLIIGILENLKTKHLEAIKTLYKKSI